MKFKKISLILLTACSSILSQAQDVKFTIAGKTALMPTDNKIKLVRYDLVNGQRFDLANVDANGLFSFSATVPEAQIGQLVWNVGQNQESAVFYLESGKINIEIKKEKRFPVLSGTTLNKDFNDYYVAMDHLLDSADAADHPSRPYSQFSKELKVPKLQLMQKFVPGHPNSLLTLYQLNNNVGRFPDEVTELAKLYNQLTPQLQKTKEGKDMAFLIKGLSANKIGDVALNFTMPNPTTGKMVNLTDFRGKYVLLDFWATWCIPCLEEMPNVVTAYQKYNGKNFEILGVALERPETKTLMIKMIKDHKMDWPQVSDLRWWNSQAALLYNIQGVPANFLIDPNGKIIAINLRGVALQEKLAEILGASKSK